jgi:hypothetical protein
MDYVVDVLIDFVKKYNINFCHLALFVSTVINVLYFLLIKDKKFFHRLPIWKKSVIIQSYIFSVLLILFWIIGVCDQVQSILQN